MLHNDYQAKLRAVNAYKLIMLN